MRFNNLTKKELRNYIMETLTLMRGHKTTSEYLELKRQYNKLVSENGYEQQYIRGCADKKELLIRAESLYAVIMINLG